MYHQGQRVNEYPCFPVRAFLRPSTKSLKRLLTFIHILSIGDSHGNEFIAGQYVPRDARDPVLLDPARDLTIWVIGTWVIKLFRAAASRAMAIRSMDPTLVRYLDTTIGVALKTLCLWQSSAR